MITWKQLAFLAFILHPGLASANNCSAVYDRIPVNSDLTVDCGTNTITLEVNLCTVQWAGFNDTTLAMNGQHNNSLCLGIQDSTVDPPVVRFHLPVNDSQENPCRTSWQIVNEAAGSGIFSAFSNIQSVVITGFIVTPRSSEGIISYSTDLYYHFSCRYPLEYFINNTQIVASSVSVATKGNNGTFINTLSMSVYNDSGYNNPLVVPDSGLALRTNVYVEVKATNLTGSFNVMLDHCFATPSPYNVSVSEQYDFFIGCNIASRTTVELNGLDLRSRFYFEAFRFVQHHSQQKSTLYLHCIVRLCEPTKCQELLNACSGNNGRRRRDVVEPFGAESPESTTVSVGPIFTRDNADAVDQASAPESGAQQGERSSSSTGLAVGLVFGCGASVLLVLGGWFVVKKYF
ncbi:zona pellucida-like domain-containing protein 1 isoform X1 [Alosa sapidissima]|uniref:zona pellucida-like domain-containing protein 1 isoform X1 n=1 Tax=Alosa sapidissima TaxID=34773 RepID=UPI001C0A5627|nr:zona pellucida-like domain-containing protein 1 isoform X1 [Alosa sapidissima]